MPNSSDQLRKAYKKKREGGYMPSGKYAVDINRKWIRTKPKPRFDQPRVDDLGKSDRLTPFERKLYDKLPGFAESGIGKALARFGQSWAGKALGYLDVAAEGLERTSGFIAQGLAAYGDPEHWKDFRENLSDAWYAGSLTADMSNLPIWKRDQAGKISGIYIPEDLPGISGVIGARRRIGELTDQGIDIGEALKQTRDEYYNEEGALALRSQLYDTYLHVLGDPINFVLPALKPVQAAHAARSAILAGRVSDAAMDAARATLKAAEASQDVERITQATTKLAELTALAGKIPKTGKPLVNLFTRANKFTIALTGGDPFKPLEQLSKFEKLTRKKSILNPFSYFALTPAARAHELMTMVSDNVGTYIISRSDDPYQIAAAISKAAKGATGDEFGHAFLTIEGRTAQGVLGGFEAQTQDLLKAWDLTTQERSTLEMIAAATGNDVHKTMSVLTEGSDNALRALAEQVGSTPDALKQLGAVLKDMPYSTDLWKLELGIRLADHTAKQGVLQFGVQGRGLLEKMALTLKSAETLAFLRLNPAYAIKNAVNNELTMLARGLWGRVGLSDLEKVWSRVGFEPIRLGQGFGMQGISLTGKPERVGAAISEALRGKRGFWDKASEAISDLKLGKLDVSAFAQQAERAASRRAMTAGYLDGWKMFWRPGKGFDYIDDFVPQAVRAQMDNDTVRHIHNAVASAMGDAEIDAATRSAININIRSLLEDAGRTSGMDVGKVLGNEFVTKIEDGLLEAARGGKTREFFAGLRTELQKHLDEGSKEALEMVAEKARLRIAAEGPQGFLHVWEDQMDEFWGTHTYHATRMESVGAKLRGILDPDVRGKMWDKILSENESYWGRTWDRFEAVLRGMKKGAKDADLVVPDEVLGNFGTWKKGWRDFFSKRNSLYRQIKEGKGGRTFDDVQLEIDNLYRDTILKEDDLTRKMDELAAGLLPDERMRSGFLAWRDKARELRRIDRNMVVEFRQFIAGMSPQDIETAYRRFWQDRMVRFQEQWVNEKMGAQMMAGDPNAATTFELASREGPNAIRRLASQYGLPSVTDEGIPLDRRILASINKYLPEGQAYTRLDDVPYDVADEALKARAGVKAGEAAQAAQAAPAPAAPPPPLQGAAKTFVPDAGKLVDWQPNLAEAEDTVWMTRGFQALDALEDAALDAASKPGLRWADLPEEVRGWMEKYLNHAKGQMADARYASLRFAEFRRDSALLNYNRRLNYNTWLGTLMPFEFWFTQSIAKWALHSIDRPAMLMSYLRIKKFMETAGLPNQGVPSRLRGSVKIDLPFLPPWMGNGAFVDPLRFALPFDTFLYPFEDERQRQTSLDGRAERLLQAKIRDGEIPELDGMEALQAKSGPLWEMALAEAQQDDRSLQFDAFDFANLMTSFHAPIVWAKEALQGTPEDIGPFMPLTRMSKGVSALLGIEQFPLLPHNIEAKVRKSLGLPAYDKWDDYRVERMLANMAALNEFPLEEIQRAMIDHRGPAWDEAQRKAGIEFGVGALGGMLGIPTKAYPEGEKMQRALADDFNGAYRAYENGDIQALNDFFDEHPEYEARLALFKKPEERMRQFMVDELWDTYNNLPDLNKREVREALGSQFMRSFIDKSTRSYESIPNEILGMWLRMMGGDPPGTLGDNALPIEMAPPEMAHRAQVFYDTRSKLFPGWYDMQKEYYMIKKGAGRKQYINNNPLLGMYWDWRRDFFHRNPDVVQYLSDDFEFSYKNEKALRKAIENQPNFQWFEWVSQASPQVGSLMMDFANGEPLPPAARDELERMAEDMGISYDELVDKVLESIEQ